MPGFIPTTEQEAVLGHPFTRDGRVLAGPGTGKSATVIAWIERQLAGSQSPRVKLLTFTRAATGELAKKVSEHPRLAAERPATIHSFSLSVILSNAGIGEFPRPLRLADDWENRSIVYPSLGRRLGIQRKRVDRLFKELAAGWESLAPQEDPGIGETDRARFLAGWQEHRRIMGYTLLAELPYTLRNALRDHPDLEGISYDMLLVDEYQDLNACDLEVLKLIRERGCKIMAIGDDDQSIYSFRKAHPAGIRRFLEDYEGSTDYPLSITHRCGSAIIGWASFVIEGDLSRSPDKRRLTPAEGSPPGEVALLSFAGHRAEPRGIAQIIDNLIRREGIDAREILVLLRSDRHGHFSKLIKEELINLAIECSNPEHVDEILSNEENRRLLATLRLMTDPSDSLAWAALLETERGVGAAFFDYVYEHARVHRVQFGEALLSLQEQEFPSAPRGTGPRACQLMATVRQWMVDRAVPEATPTGGWARWIQEQWINNAHNQPMPQLSAPLFELMVGVDELVEDDLSLDRYLGQLPPLAKDRAQNMSPGVRIMTMAASKGLTVEVAILSSVEEGVVPRPDMDVNEERRLLYVAMTRAKSRLYCTWARRRSGPTARTGRTRVGGRRNLTTLLEDGPVTSQDGDVFIRARWAGN